MRRREAAPDAGANGARGQTHDPDRTGAQAMTRSTRCGPAPESDDAAPHRATSLSAAALADLRAQLDDIVAAALDATEPPGRRTLGRREARRQIVEAARKCEAIFALAGKRSP
jgi:hypothetical protein